LYATISAEARLPALLLAIANCKNWSVSPSASINVLVDVFGAFTTSDGGLTVS
jgi:hypothetical protein